MPKRTIHNNTSMTNTSQTIDLHSAAGQPLPGYVHASCSGSITTYMEGTQITNFMYPSLFLLKNKEKEDRKANHHTKNFQRYFRIAEHQNTMSPDDSDARGCLLTEKRLTF